MPPNRVPEFPNMFLVYLNEARRSGFASIQLGGTGGSGGGSGSPPGGFVGQLIQTQVTYDTTEASSTSGSSSLLDNLNHIRKRITTLETTGSTGGFGGGSGTTTGSGVAGQVAFWTSGSSLGGDPGLLYNRITDRLTLATSGSGAGLLMTDVLLWRKSARTLDLGGTLEVDEFLKLTTSGSGAGLLMVDTLLWRKSSRTISLGGSLEVDETLKVGGVQALLTGASLNYVLTFDGTKYVGAPSGSGVSGLSGFGTSPEIAYFTSGSVLASTNGLEWYPGGTSKRLYLWGNGASPAGVSMTIENATSGSTADAFINLQNNGGVGDGSPYTVWQTGSGYFALGINPLTDDLTLNYGFPYVPGRAGTNTALRVTTSGSVYWASSRQSWGGSFIQFDSAMRLAPSGAINGNVLGYDGTKWVPTSATSGSTSVGIDGWTSAGETWTYVSADGPTGVFSVPADVTAKYSSGMRVRYVQSAATKYGIITTTGSWSGSVTQITLYGGTDYTTGSGAITSPYYSTVKAPFGFNLDPLKWTVEASTTSSTSQATPSTGTWYNIGSLTISIPIGAWRVSYQAALGMEGGASGAEIFSTLSTANNSESDTDMTVYAYGGAAAAATFSYYLTVMREKHLLLATKTSYYLNEKTSTGSMSSIRLQAASSKTIIRAVCAYL